MQVVAVGEAVGLDLDPIADDALDGEAPGVDRRRDVLDDGADAAIGGQVVGGAWAFIRAASAIAVIRPSGRPSRAAAA